LNAVVPAGAKDRAGTKKTLFVEAIPEDELKNPEPELTTKQSQVLDQLRKIGEAVEVQQLTRQVRCGPGPVEALVVKGLVRRTTRRIDRFSEKEEAVPVCSEPVTLNEDQQKVWESLR